MKSIYKKITKVMKEIRTVKKNGRNDFNKYDYAMEKDLLDEVKPLLLENGLLVIPNVLEQQRAGDIATVKVEFTLVDTETDEELKTIFYGEGQDKGDKATYKAYTGACKYYLMKTFMIPTGDDPERDDNPKQSKKRKLQPKAQPKAAPKAKLTEIRKKWLSLSTQDKLDDYMNLRFKKTLADLSENEANAILDKLNENLTNLAMTAKQRKALFGKGKGRGLTSDQTKQVAYKYCSLDSLTRLSALQAYEVGELIDNMKDEELRSYTNTKPQEESMSKGSLIQGFADGVQQMQVMGG